MSADEQTPETRYATFGDDRIAYQVFGDGDLDLIFAPVIGDGIDLRWDWPSYVSFLRRLATQARVIMFDLRGTGASDAPSGETLPIWDRWADEAQAVLDAVASERAVLLGHADGGPTAVLFAATHPDRTRGLILGNTAARFAVSDDDPGAFPIEVSRFIQEAWGTEAFAEFGSPDAARDPAFRRFIARSQRQSLSPRDASILHHLEQSMDVREVLASVRVPTLVLHRQGFKIIAPDRGRYLAEQIPGARFALVPGNDGALYTEPVGEILGEIEKFLIGLRGVVEPDRALAAILFTDIVGSTERASALGDSQWRNLLDSHDAVARTLIDQHRGRLVKMTGDGVLATFDGPGRAIRCALTLRDSLQPLGIEIRAGLHTGEVELRGEDIGGIGVHIAARVLHQACAGELLASAAVPLLVAGSGLEFEDRGEHELKGVGPLRLYAVEG